MLSRIKELRKSLNMSQNQFSKSLNLSFSYFSKIESRENKLNDRIIQLICLTYNVNEHWLRTGEGSMFNPVPATSKSDADIARDSFDESFTEQSVEDFVAAAEKLPLQFQKLIIEVGLRLCEKQDNPPPETDKNAGFDKGNP